MKTIAVRVGTPPTTVSRLTVVIVGTCPPCGDAPAGAPAPAPPAGLAGAAGAAGAGTTGTGAGTAGAAGGWARSSRGEGGWAVMSG